MGAGTAHCGNRRTDCREQTPEGREMCQKSKNFVLISSTSQRSREQGHLTRKRRGEEVWGFKTKENVGGMQLRECGDLEPLKPHSSP